MFCPLEGHPTEHLPIVCKVGEHPKRHFIMFCPLEGQPREHGLSALEAFHSIYLFIYFKAISVLIPEFTCAIISINNTKNLKTLTV